MDTQVVEATKVDLENIRQYSHSLGSSNAPITVIEFEIFNVHFVVNGIENYNTFEGEVCRIRTS